jgi:5'-nucleotidase
MKRPAVVCGVLAVAGSLAFACSDDATVGPEGDAGPEAAATESSVDSSVPAAGEIQLLSISDWHGQLEGFAEADADKVNQVYGGISTLKAYFDRERVKNPSTLVFTAGDAFGGTPVVSNYFDDEPAIKGLNYLGVAADTFGNHNFDRGVAGAKTLIEQAAFPYVSTNLTNVAAELGTKVVAPYAMLELGEATQPGGKIKVAVLGITNPDAPTLVFPGKMGALVVEEPIKAANDAAAKARAAGANVIVCLAHLGATSKDSSGEPTGPAIDFAKGLTGIDIVLADHTDVAFSKIVGGALVIENRSKGRTYARIAVKVENGKVASKAGVIVDPIGLHTALLTCDAGTEGGTCTCPETACPATYTCTTAAGPDLGKCQKNDIPPDPAGDALVKTYKDQLSTKFDVKIGTATALFPRGPYPTATDKAIERVAETPIGNIVADALLDAYKTSDGAQIAFTNGGGIRDSLPAKDYAPKATTFVRPPAAAPWDITVGDATSVLRFNNSTVVRKIKGQLLWQALEFSVAKLPAADGRFLQIAGFKYTFDRTKMPRIQSVTLLAGNKDIPSTDATEYVAVTNDFTSSGGDGYAMLKEANPSAARDVMVDLFVTFIKKTATLDPTVYSANPRIIDVTP